SNKTTAPRKTFCRRPRPWSPITSSAKGKIFGPRAKAAQRSVTTRLPTAKTKRCLPPTGLRATCAKPPRRARSRAWRCFTGRILSRACLKKPCAATSSNIMWSADSLSLLRVINTPARGIGKTTMEVIERLAMETGLSLWGAIGETIRRELLPQRALAALKVFRDLIEDARAMLGGNYAERLEQSARDAKPDEGAMGVSPDTVEASDQAEEIDFDLENFSFDFGEQAEEFPLPEETAAEETIANEAITD